MRYGKWEAFRELGSGGQGTAHVALDTTKMSLERVAERTRSLINELHAIKTREDSLALASEFLALIERYHRRELGDQCAVVKVLHEPARADAKALARLEREVAVLSATDDPSIIKIIDTSIKDGWFVTPYYPNGALSQYGQRFQGDALSALVALRPVVEATAKLHEQGIVHRDIKPENIFVDGTRLVLGDFGIAWVHQEGRATRVSGTYENVGSRDWMPGWAMGMRIEEDVPPAFDVFGLGKVLWAMVSGRTKLRLWYFDQPEFNLIEQFPYDPRIRWVNQILERSVVEHQRDSWATARDMLYEFDQAITRIRNGGQIVRRDVPRVCTVCGGGTYQPVVDETTPPAAITNLGLNPIGTTYRIFQCVSCGHLQWFKVNPPRWEDE